MVMKHRGFTLIELIITDDVDALDIAGMTEALMLN